MPRHECAIVNKVAYRFRSVDFVPYASMRNHIGLFGYAFSSNQRQESKSGVREREVKPKTKRIEERQNRYQIAEFESDTSRNPLFKVPLTSFIIFLIFFFWRGISVFPHFTCISFRWSDDRLAPTSTRKLEAVSVNQTETEREMANNPNRKHRAPGKRTKRNCSRNDNYAIVFLVVLVRMVK